MRLLHKTSASKSNLELAKAPPQEYIVEYLSIKVNRLELNYIKLYRELKAVTQKPVFKQSDLELRASSPRALNNKPYKGRYVISKGGSAD